MKILLSNDDGIEAPGLRILAEALKEHADLLLVAPDREQSAIGHAITIHDPLKVSERFHKDEFFGYAVNGTPADCVKLALCSIMEKPPDLLISGINQGANLGTDIIYSGTVSAATEGTLLGIPSIAISVDSYKRTARFDTAAKVAVDILKYIPEFDIPPGTLLNINVPDINYEKIKGRKFTCQGKTKFVEKYVKRIDPRGNAYYWIAGEVVEMEEIENADYSTVKNEYVSITPVHFDVTNYDYLGSIRKKMENII